VKPINIDASIASATKARNSPKNAGAASVDDSRLRAFRAYLDCATRALGGKSPALILMSGLSGSGKTWLAERLAPLLGAVHLRSDIERKRLAGVDDRARTGSALGEGMYSKDFTARVYASLAAAVDDILSGGYTAIVDATFSRREDRDAFRKLATRLGVPARLIHCHASREVLRSRIAERDREGRDASEADVAVLEWQRLHCEPVAAEEGWTVIPVNTGDVDLTELSQQVVSLKT
jgi:predicted kinase